MNAPEYAEHTANNTAAMLKEVTLNPDGTTRGMPGDVTAGVLIAQSNLAIAAALMMVADVIEKGRK